MKYTKEDLERIISVQLENLEAMEELVTLMKEQNELLHRANEDVRIRIAEIKMQRVRYKRIS